MGADGGRGARVGRWVTSRPLTHVALAVAVLASGVVGALGGLAPTEPESLPSREIGAPLDTGPLTVQVDAVTSVPELGPAYPETPGVRYVVVSGTVTGRSDSPVSPFEVAESVTLPDLPDPLDGLLQPTDSGPGDVLVLEDAAPPAAVGAGISYEVVWVFRTGSDPDDGARVPVLVHGQTLRADNITTVIGWFDPVPFATVTVPLERRAG